MRKIKNYLKTGILLLGISLLLWNCEKEDSEIIQSESDSDFKIEIVTLKQIESNPIASNKLNKIITKTSNKLSNYASKDIYNAQYNFTVNTDYVKYIEKGEYHSYNFPITRENPVDDNIENLLLSLNKDGGYDAYLVQYVVPQESLANLSIEELNKIIAHFTPINLDSSSLLAARLSFECVIDRFLYCPLGGGHTEGFGNDCELEIAVISTCSWVNSGGSSDGTATGSETTNDGTNETSGGTGGTSSTNDDNSIISTPTVDEYVECTGGKIKNFKNECVCPDGYIEDADGNCIEDDDCDTSGDDLKKVFPNTSDSKLEKIADAINKYGKDFGIDTKEKLQHFLAQAGHESAKFTAFNENLNYRWSKLGTTDYWQKYFNPISDPTKNSNKENPNDYKRDSTSVYVDKEKFANYVYNDENRSSKGALGNTVTGDGYKYRGRGIFQLTGRDNYQRFTDFYQDEYDKTKDFITNPSLISSDMVIAVISALWFYKNNVQDKLTIDSNTTVDSVTLKVNGGYKGLEDRKTIHTKAKTNIDCI